MGILDGYHLGSLDPATHGLTFTFYGVTSARDWRHRALPGMCTMVGALHRCVRAGHDPKDGSSSSAPAPLHSTGHRPDDPARHDPQCPDRAGNFHARAARVVRPSRQFGFLIFT